MGSSKKRPLADNRVEYQKGNFMKPENQQKNVRVRKIVLIATLSLVGLCLLAVGTSWVTNQFLPSDIENADEMSPQDIARTEESLNLMSGLGEQTWVGMDDTLPLIIWNDSHAFLVNSEKEFEGWEVLGSSAINGRPVYVQENEADYQAFTEVLPDGRYAGSMASKEAVNIGFIELFGENLPPVIDQVFPYRLIMLSTDHYITTLVHETFHAYQAENYPARFEDSEKAYPSTDAYESRFPEMSEGWQEEIQLLIDAVEAEDSASRKSLAKAFLDARDQRRSEMDLSPTLVRYEKRYEWLEGSAKYVELEIWENAASATDYQPYEGLSIDKDFSDYAGYQKRWKNELINMKSAAKNGGDTLFYYSGMMQERLLDDLLPGWQSQMGETDVWVEDLLREAVN